MIGRRSTEETLDFLDLLGAFDPRTVFFFCEMEEVEVEFEMEVERLKVVAVVKLLTLLLFWEAAMVAN